MARWSSGKAPGAAPSRAGAGVKVQSGDGLMELRQRSDRGNALPPRAPLRRALLLSIALLIAAAALLFLGRDVFGGSPVAGALATLAALLLGGAGGAVLTSRRLAHRLARLAAAAEAVAAGDYDRPVSAEGGDEARRIAAALSRVGARAREHREALDRQAEDDGLLAEELVRSNRQLQEAREAAEHARREAEAAQRAAERARDEAEAANEAKSRFLATVSHEIRTPINAIVGYADLIAQGVSGPVTDKQRENLERIRRSSEHLMSLVSELLDLARIESGKFVPERVSGDVGEAVETALALARPEAAACGVVLQAEASASSSAPYLGDPLRVRQIVLNLVSNAIKFTAAGRGIRVSWGAGEREGAPGPGRWSYVEVQDEGVGIEPEQIERIFQPFVQVATASTGSHGGAGLGLTISRQLARLMDGDLTVESAPGVGSRFTLWLPHRPPQLQPPELRERPKRQRSLDAPRRPS